LAISNNVWPFFEDDWHIVLTKYGIFVFFCHFGYFLANHILPDTLFYSRRTKSLPSADFELDPSPKDARLVNAFIRGRSSDKTDPAYITLDPADQTLPLYNNDDPGGTLQQQMIRSKDTVNQVCLIYKGPYSLEKLSLVFC
jgi:hypothetical protein